MVGARDGILTGAISNIFQIQVLQADSLGKTVEDILAKPPTPLRGGYTRHQT